MYFCHTCFGDKVEKMWLRLKVLPTTASPWAATVLKSCNENTEAAQIIIFMSCQSNDCAMWEVLFAVTNTQIIITQHCSYPQPHRHLASYSTLSWFGCNCTILFRCHCSHQPWFKEQQEATLSKKGLLNSVHVMPSSNRHENKVSSPLVNTVQHLATERSTSLRSED